ncbi:dihydrofolate reductase family protein [Acaryochloris marina]|uniref:Riboflavin biosynthesis protein RibD C-terminus domain protein n=1 Tax=Acaryochloris marina (strain MBIC 11017) TaxID=329726 RepID=A8ZK75_ACAM1|nr:dihydrofolate reductase family protein [Acaryochloris marina]ABW31575.1 riboflavin biosynthesis protein RibD C-terminus domain protein [Acaryochloris marina MBIC11017]
MRELTYFVACSVDGYIAHIDGSHDGFSQDPEYFADVFATFPETVPSHLRDALGVHGENKWFDVVLMGRKTYEIGLKEGVTSPYSHLKQYLFSRSINTSPDENVELVSNNTIDLVTSLKSQSGKGIWLCGGGDLATTLFAHHLVDQLILKINPFLMVSGIPLFSGVIQQTALELTDHKIYENGVLLLYYRVK